MLSIIEALFCDGTRTFVYACVNACVRWRVYIWLYDVYVLHATLTELC